MIVLDLLPLDLVLLDIDPNVVKPGWTPLIITIVLAAVMVLLYFSMRRQFRKINVVQPGPPAASTPPASPQEPTTKSPTSGS